MPNETTGAQSPVSDVTLSAALWATEMIIRGGEHIHAREVEGVIDAHPQVAASCVVGIPDRHFGEVVLAWVKPRPSQSIDERELRAFCERKLARFKVPIHFRWVDEFPLTSTGKLNKKLIVEIEVEALADVNVIQTA